MQQMHFADSYALNKNVFTLFLNVSSNSLLIAFESVLRLTREATTLQTSLSGLVHSLVGLHKQ